MIKLLLLSLLIFACNPCSPDLEEKIVTINPSTMFEEPWEINNLHHISYHTDDNTGYVSANCVIFNDSGVWLERKCFEDSDIKYVIFYYEK